MSCGSIARFSKRSSRASPGSRLVCTRRCPSRVICQQAWIWGKENFCPISSRRRASSSGKSTASSPASPDWQRINISRQWFASSRKKNPISNPCSRKSRKSFTSSRVFPWRMASSNAIKVSCPARPSTVRVASWVSLSAPRART